MLLGEHGMTEHGMIGAMVTIQQCWGCNRRRARAPWASPTMVQLLESEGRLRIEETCVTTMIVQHTPSLGVRV